MSMATRSRLYGLVIVAAIVAIVSAGVLIGSNNASASASPGEIDDGAELLPQASISLDEALEAAQSAASGGLGEVDLEYYQGALVFNVDVGNQDVKVDASTGSVLGFETEEAGNDSDGDD